MNDTSGRNILFFFNTRINYKYIEQKKYINRIDEANERPFEGIYHYITAGAKSIHDHLASNKNLINHIICVSDIADDNKDYLTTELNKVLEDSPPLTWISHDRYDNSDIILQKISSQFVFSSNDTIYIITNGGARNNVMFFSTFTQIMKTKGLDTRLIYITQETPEIIKDVSSDNRYFDVLRAVELFTQSGNPKMLKDDKIYGNDQNLNKLLSYMEQFYQSIQICKTVNNASTGIVSIFKEMIEEIDHLMEKDGIDIIIRLLLPTIKSKFMPLGTDNPEYFLQILQWCCNNDMVLVGFFILDAELKAYLYNDKKVIRFIGFEQEGKSINLTSLKSLETIKIREKDLENYKKSLSEVNGEHYVRGYTEALTIIFRYIVSKTKYIDTSRLNPSNPTSFFDKFIKQLEAFDLNLYCQAENNLKMYELILLQDFIRSLRNNMAHAENDFTIKGRTNLIGLVRKKYKYRETQDGLFNYTYEDKYNSTNYPDIKFDDPEIYDKLIFILSTSIKIIQDSIKILSSEVEDEY